MNRIDTDIINSLDWDNMEFFNAKTCVLLHPSCMEIAKNKRLFSHFYHSAMGELQLLVSQLNENSWKYKYLSYWFLKFSENGNILGLSYTQNWYVNGDNYMNGKFFADFIVNSLVHMLKQFHNVIMYQDFTLPDDLKFLQHNSDDIFLELKDKEDWQYKLLCQQTRIA